MSDVRPNRSSYPKAPHGSGSGVAVASAFVRKTSTGSHINEKTKNDTLKKNRSQSLHTRVYVCTCFVSIPYVVDNELVI